MERHFNSNRGRMRWTYKKASFDKFFRSSIHSWWFMLEPLNLLFLLPHKSIHFNTKMSRLVARGILSPLHQRLISPAQTCDSLHVGGTPFGTKIIILFISFMLKKSICLGGSFVLLVCSLPIDTRSRFY
ncbi:hypothetical protein BJ742DRAFT_227561 [Cladochytrium replicatum]|nr:hypothetical protein BJ742DRAFT_227561 [Cladochytrium replicatum]